jgi:hypothetical protein
MSGVQYPHFDSLMRQQAHNIYALTIKETFIKKCPEKSRHGNYYFLREKIYFVAGVNHIPTFFFV